MCIRDRCTSQPKPTLRPAGCARTLRAQRLRAAPTGQERPLATTCRTPRAAGVRCVLDERASLMGHLRS
eukprot:3446570-Pyramimonas_sp.AAC.1